MQSGQFTNTLLPSLFKSLKNNLNTAYSTVQYSVNSPQLTVTCAPYLVKAASKNSKEKIHFQTINQSSDKSF